MRMKRMAVSALLLVVTTFVSGCFLFNKEPIANLTAFPTSGIAPLTVRFDASLSLDPDGEILSYEWTFGDGENLEPRAETSKVVSHTFTRPGVYTAQLVVTDNQGKTSSTTVTIYVSANVPPSLSLRFMHL